jgi:pimeloyl-ACP methyl ester carboxylesterase
MPLVEAAGVALAYEEHGSGPAALLVHGTATDHSAWRETIGALGDGVRAIAYDRRGYGESEAPEPYGGTTVGEQADDASAILRALDAVPAVVCGQGVGALVCLDLVVREPALVRGAVLIDPPVLWLVHDGPDEVAEMREAVERGARDGGGAGAVDAYLAHEGGPRSLELLGPERMTAARAAVRAFAADLGAGPSWPASRADMEGISVPVTILAGTRGREIHGRVARLLADLLPRTELRELDAGPLGHLEAPAEVAAAVRELASGGGAGSV